MRRFVTFGVIKGFLYRVHKYAVLTNGAGAAALTGSRRALLRGNPPEGLLDGMHSFDELCTELGVSEQTLMRRLKGNPDVQIIYR